MKHFMIYLATYTLGSGGIILAQETSPIEVPNQTSSQTQDTPSKPSMDVRNDIKQLDKNTIQIGELKLNKKEQTITFPAKVLLVDQPIEYLLINPHGKAHEALLITNLRPLHLNVAMKLLHYKESHELFQKVDDQHIPTGEWIEESDEVKKASRFHLYVSWEQNGKQKSAHINDLLMNTQTEKPPPHSPFIYNGSYIFNQSFKADENGDIIALFTDKSSVANFSGKGRDDDSIWIPNKKIIPEIATKVTLTIRKNKTKE